jgi:hypothetical protein
MYTHKSNWNRGTRRSGITCCELMQKLTLERASRRVARQVALTSHTHGSHVTNTWLCVTGRQISFEISQADFFADFRCGETLIKCVCGGLHSDMLYMSSTLWMARSCTASRSTLTSCCSPSRTYACVSHVSFPRSCISLAGIGTMPRWRCSCNRTHAASHTIRATWVLHSLTTFSLLPAPCPWLHACLPLQNANLHTCAYTRAASRTCAQVIRENRDALVAQGGIPILLKVNHVHGCQHVFGTCAIAAPLQAFHVCAHARGSRSCVPVL